MTVTSSRQRGMTIIEALIGILLLSLIFIAFFSMLDMSVRVAKNQGNISDATENLRFSVAALVKNVRMAGTGGVPLVYYNGTAMTPLALAVDDNAAATTIGGRTTVANTDVLTVRGVISGELYDIKGAVAVNSAGTEITVPNASPYSGSPQNLLVPSDPSSHMLIIGLQLPLNVQAAPASGITGVRKYSQYRIASVTSAALQGGTPPTSMTIDFSGTGSPGTLNWNGSYSTFAHDQAFDVGFLDQLQFFIGTNDAGEPTLYRYHGTGVAEELVPNISNLQIALGCDVNQNGTIEDSEWFLSAAHPGAPSGDQLVALTEVRLSVVARSQEPDMNYTEAQAGQPEDGVALTGDDLHYRHRVITVRVALRSHPILEAA